MGENFDINNFDARDNNENIGELSMSVSAICSNKNNEKYICESQKSNMTFIINLIELT